MSHYAFNWFALPLVMTALCSLTVGLQVLRRQWTSRVGQALFLVTLTVSAWFGATALGYFSTDSSTAHFWTHVAYIAVPLVPAAIYLYIAVGLRLYRSQRVLVWALAIAALVFIVLTYSSDLLLSGVEKFWWGYGPAYGPAGPYFVGYFGLVIALGVIQLRGRLRETPKGSLFHRRLSMSLLSVGVISLGAVDFFARFGIRVYPFGHVAVLAFLVVILVLEKRYRIVYMTPAFAAGQILATMQGAILVTTPEGMVEMGNHAASELLGCSETELTQLSLDKVFESETEWRSLLHDCLAAKEVRDFETSWRRRDGGAMDVSISASPMPDGGGRPLGIVFAALDITDRKKTEEALRLTQLSVDRAADLIHWIAQDGRLLYVSDSTCQRHGYSREDLLGMTIFDLDPSQSPGAWRKHWREMREQGSLSFESAHRTKVGEVFPVELTVNHVECNGREYAFAFGRDISERKRIEGELARSEEHFRALIENSSDLIAVMDSEGVIQFQSPSSLRMLGYHPEEVEGKNAFDLVHPDDVATSQRAFAELARGEWDPSQMLETRFRHKDGSWRTLEVMGKKLDGPSGEPLSVLNSRDVTARKLWEEELAVEKERLSLLNEAAVEMGHCLTASEVQKAGIRLACKTTNCDGGVIWLLPSEVRDRIIGSEGLTRKGRAQLISMLRTSPAVERVMGERISVRLQEAELLGGGTSDGNVFAGALLVPIVSRGGVLGVLCLATEPDHSGLTAADSILAEGIAALVGVALENARLYDDARYLARRDPVTGLLNHRGINAQLEKEVARSERSGGCLAVVMMDLDNFKLFNDTYGHVSGDQVLQNVSAILAKSVRRADLVGRYGGDEFVALLPDTDAGGAVRTIERIRKTLAESGYSADGGSLVPVFMSYGVATYPFEGRHVSELLAAADANLYRSKRQGGDCVTAPGSGEERSQTESGIFTVLEGLVTAVDGKDHYTRKHSDDVSEQAVLLASELGLSSETQRCLRIAALLHDVGKIGIPDHILRKPGDLTAEEYEAVKQHVDLGGLIINEIPNLADVLGAVSSHHERYDGQGYPRGLRGEHIPLLGRILAVTDAYSAMTTDRPYRKALTLEEARSELKRVSGTQLDPRVVVAFLAVLDESSHSGAPAGVSSVTAA